MPWWGWLIVVIAAFVLLVVVVGGRFHKKVRREFVEYLAAAYPQFQIAGQSTDGVLLRMSGIDTFQLNLQRVIDMVHAASANTPEQRRPIYEQFAASLLADAEEYNRTLNESDRQHIMPRLVTTD